MRPISLVLLFFAAWLPLAPSASAQEQTNVYEFDSGLPIDGAPKPKLKPGTKAPAGKTRAESRSQAVAQIGDTPTPKRKPNAGRSGSTSAKARASSPSLAGRSVSRNQTNFPKPLSSSDVEAYRDAFRANDKGDWAAADAALGRTQNPLLRGHVLAKRYRNLDYSASRFELEAWVRSFPDHPDAPRIARLARNRGAINLPRVTGRETALPIPALEPARRYKAGREDAAYRALMRALKDDLWDDRYNDAENRLNNQAIGVLDSIEIANQRARIAANVYYDGNCRDAVPMTSRIINNAGQKAPLAYWIAGLCAYRAQNFGDAYTLFKGFASSRHTDRWEKAAGHFWAGRAKINISGLDAAQADLEKAARYHETFYGLMARMRIGWKTRSAVDSYKPTKADLDRLMTWKGGKRAFGLIQVGETRAAELELMFIARKKESALRDSIMRTAGAAGLPALSLRLGHYSTLRLKKHDYAALYPIPAYRPNGGFTIDRALLYGIMRQESFFRPRLASAGAGAKGILQVYPPTAKWMVRKGMVKSYRDEELLQPSRNLQIGQRYLKYLLKENKNVKSDLVRFTLGYNAGPNRINQWYARADREGTLRDDPLMFMESLPALETRNYIEHTLAYIWRYRDRMGQPLTEAAELARGQWPKYRSMD